MARIMVVAFGICGFLVGGPARADLQADLTAAGGNPGAKLVVIQGQTLNVAGLQVPNGVTILATGAQITSTHSVTLGSDTRIIGGHWKFSKGGFTSTGASNIYYDGVTIDALGEEFIEIVNNQPVTNKSKVGSAAMHTGGANLTLVNCRLFSAARNGLYAQDVEHVVVDGGKYNNSGWNGILLSGGADHLIDPDDASRNVLYSGINLARAKNVKVGSPLCSHNGEHGISLQGMNGFDVDWPMCNYNKSGGISLQDDRLASAPCQNGALGGYYRCNYAGIRFIDTNRNILIKAGTTAIYNTDVQIRFHTLTISQPSPEARRSDMIVGRHLNLNSPPPIGPIDQDDQNCVSVQPWMINSNDSTRVNITNKENMTPEFTGEQMASNGFISTTTRGNTHIYIDQTSSKVLIDPSLELYLVRFLEPNKPRKDQNSVNDLNGTYTTHMHDGMIATFCANESGGFRIRHNVIETGIAPFWLVGSDPNRSVFLTHRSCITFRAQSLTWYELSRSIF